MRPSVSRPTGTVIGSPVSMASMPRTMPSVGFMATQRTRFSPRCCATSTTTSIGTPRGSPGSRIANGVVDRRQVPLVELDVDDRADDLDDLADAGRVLRLPCWPCRSCSVLSSLQALRRADTISISPW